MHPRGRIRVFSVLSRAVDVYITKTRLYNFDPFKSHFYIVKLGFTGVYIIFFILLKDIECRCSLEPPMSLSRNIKNIRFFLTEIFLFW